MGISVDDMLESTSYVQGVLDANGITLHDGEVWRGDEIVPRGATTIYQFWNNITYPDLPFAEDEAAADYAARRNALFPVRLPVDGWRKLASRGTELHALISQALNDPARGTALGGASFNDDDIRH